MNDTNNKKELYNYGRYKLIFKEYSPFYDFKLLIRGERGDADHTSKKDDGTHFKAVYRWNNDSEPNIDFENKIKSYLDL
ncbi:MAG: hypothetical protein OHM56_08005 [Spiroplasma phoeniceum]|nr:MAG: hypothetical protein OHM57_07405 [Spiroplasma phoeniceum]UZQ31571.1 MAG: hypothetical protein OHM56_08005 [Spiroplasma phoeniceum]